MSGVDFGLANTVGNDWLPYSQPVGYVVVGLLLVDLNGGAED